MANERDDQEPRIRIIDRRGMSEPSEDKPTPKLEIVGGSASGSGTTASSSTTASGSTTTTTTTATSSSADDTILQFGTPAQTQQGDEATDLSDEPELTEEEAAQLEAQFESEQFAQIEAQMGRPLNEAEKGQVREEMERQAQQMSRLEVAPLLQNTMSELSARAAIHLGLMPNPYTRLIARNDTQARIAIDAFSALYEIVRPTLPPQYAQEFARVLNDLRVNFASITGHQITGPSRIIR